MGYSSIDGKSFDLSTKPSGIGDGLKAIFSATAYKALVSPASKPSEGGIKMTCEILTEEEKLHSLKYCFQILKNASISKFTTMLFDENQNQVLSHGDRFLYSSLDKKHKQRLILNFEKLKQDFVEALSQINQYLEQNNTQQLISIPFEAFDMKVVDGEYKIVLDAKKVKLVRKSNFGKNIKEHINQSNLRQLENYLASLKNIS